MKRLTLAGMMVVSLAAAMLLGFAGEVRATPQLSVEPAVIEVGAKPNTREDYYYGWNVKIVNFHVYDANEDNGRFQLGGGYIFDRQTGSATFRVVINEVHIGPDGNWVELYNPSYSENSLSYGKLTFSYTTDGVNWTEDSYTFASNAKMASGSYLRIMEGTGTNTATRIYMGKSFGWTNDTSGRVRINTTSWTDTSGDKVCWGGHPDCPYPLATPRPDQGLGRNGFGTDLNLAQDWHYSTPTPEASNDPSQTSVRWVRYSSTYWMAEGVQYPGEAAIGLDFNGMAPGVYTTTLYFFSDDPNQYMVPIPVTLHVGYPEMSVSVPDPLEVTLVPGDIATKTISLANSSPWVAGKYWINGGLSQSDDVRLNEIFMGDPYSTAPSWVELHNASDHGIDMSLYDVEYDSSGAFTGGQGWCRFPWGFVIPAGGYVRMVGGWGTTTASEIFCYTADSMFNFKPTEESTVLLYHSHYKGLDFLNWGDKSPGLSIEWSTIPEQWLNTGHPIPFLPLNNSLARDSLSTDTDSDVDWTITSNPTPNAPNEGQTLPASWLSYRPGTGLLASNASKEIQVTIKAAGLSPGDYAANLAISTQDPNHPKFLVPVVLHVQTGAIVSVLDKVIDDDNLGASHGNGNQIVEPGEQIEMGVVLKNSGLLPAWNVTGVLSTSDPYVTIIHDTESFGIIQAASERLCFEDFNFTVSPTAPHDHQVVFNLYIYDQNGSVWYDTITVVISVDSDHDGMPDYWEQQYASCGLDYLTPDANGDQDLDGLTNLQEYLAGTDPCNPDTDSDCILDGQDNAITPGIGCERMVAPAGDWNLRVTLLDASAGLDSDIYLYRPQDELLIEHSLENVGAVSTVNIAGGEDLELYIKVHGEPMGLGTYDHYSNTIYANVTDEGYGTWVIGFEDLPVGMADWDYNDVVVLVELMPASKHYGVTVNYLGETELTSDAGDANSLTAKLSDPSTGFNTSLAIPRADLFGDAAVILTNADPALYSQVLANAPFVPIDVMRKVLLTNGQQDLGDAAGSLTLSYLDQDQNGLVDGTGILEGSLGIYRYDAHNQTWIELDSAVDPAGNFVTASTSHFSLFAVGADPNFVGGPSSSKHHGSGNGGNWFGCSLNPGLGAAPGIAGLLPMFLIAAAGAIAMRFRSSKK